MSELIPPFALPLIFAYSSATRRECVPQKSFSPRVAESSTSSRCCARNAGSEARSDDRAATRATGSRSTYRDEGGVERRLGGGAGGE